MLSYNVVRYLAIECDRFQTGVYLDLKMVRALKCSDYIWLRNDELLPEFSDRIELSVHRGGTKCSGRNNLVTDELHCDVFAVE